MARGLDDATDLWRELAVFRPRQRQRLLDWCRQHVANDLGRPYDHAAYPHLGAPGGPMDAYDDANVRHVVLQWATRLGKSFFGQCCTLFNAQQQPGPQMFASAAEKLAGEVNERTYKMIRQSPVLSVLLLKPEKYQRRDLIELSTCNIFVAWARSVTTLSDKNIRFGWANELDKWVVVSTSKEADPERLFRDRFKDFQSIRKVIFESTPTLRGNSRIESLRLDGSNCQFWILCPHCREYQVPKLSQITWERLKNGDHDPFLAQRTATYRCERCAAQIHNHERSWAMRRGVWCPEGAWPRPEAIAVAEAYDVGDIPDWQGWGSCDWIEGDPLRDGESATYQLSSLAALTLTWGDIAKEFVECKDSPGLLRNFRNQWLAETWDIVERRGNKSDLLAKMVCELPRATIPSWATLVTIGVDKQQDHYVWLADAWGPDKRSHTIDYGTVGDGNGVLEVVRRRWVREDGERLGVGLALVDAGYRPSEVYALCREARRASLKLLPCRGSATPLNTFVVRRKLSKYTANPGQTLVMVDTGSTQDWVDRALHVFERGQPGAASVFWGAADDHDSLMEQLLNDAPVMSTDSRNYVRESWTRVDTEVPNDYRDCKRYAFAAMIVHSRGGKIASYRPRKQQRGKPPSQRTDVATTDGMFRMIRRRSNGGKQ